MAACEKKGIGTSEIAVANDALTVVVNKENDWAECLTIEQLKKIWEPGSTVNNWNQVDPTFPDEPLKLFGAGTDSGTFDYFTDEINGEEGASRTDYQPSEDDNVIVQGVSGHQGRPGLLRLLLLRGEQGQAQGVEVDGGDGCVAPSAETVQDGTYKPLARPLFIYPSAAALERPEVEAFVEFYVENDDEIAEEAQVRAAERGAEDQADDRARQPEVQGRLVTVTAAAGADRLGGPARVPAAVAPALRRARHRGRPVRSPPWCRS